MRYKSFSEGLGAKVKDGSATLEECEEFISKSGEPKAVSGKQEKYELILNRYFL